MRSFVDLPSELRNYVYAYLYEHPDSIVTASAKLGSDSITLHRLLGDRNHKLKRVRSEKDSK